MKREIIFQAAYDKRTEGYGRHGVDIRFVLKGDAGAVQFVMFTDWPFNDLPSNLFPMAADLGYHSPTPRYEGQDPTTECPYLDGKTCYYDGSGLNAEPVMQKLFTGGSDAVWAELESYYAETFTKEPIP